MHLLYKRSCLPPLSFLSLERVQTVDSLRSRHRAVVLFETGSPQLQGFVGPACSELSGCPPPPLATLSCYAFSISCPLLGFTAHIKPSPSPQSREDPPQGKQQERFGFLCLPSVPRSQCSLLHTCLPVARGTSGHLRQEPQCLQGAAKSILSWLQTKRKKEFFLSLIFFFQTSVHSILRLPGHHS